MLSAWAAVTRMEPEVVSAEREAALPAMSSFMSPEVAWKARVSASDAASMFPEVVSIRTFFAFREGTSRSPEVVLTRTSSKVQVSFDDKNAMFRFDYALTDWLGLFAFVHQFDMVSQEARDSLSASTAPEAKKDLTMFGAGVQVKF